MRLSPCYTIQRSITLVLPNFSLDPRITASIIPAIAPINISLIITAFILLCILFCCLTHIYIVHIISSTRSAVALLICFYNLIYYSTPLYLISSSFFYCTPLYDSFLNVPIYYISTAKKLTSLACGHSPPFSSLLAITYGSPRQLGSDGAERYFYEAPPPETSPAAPVLFPPCFPLLLPPVRPFSSPNAEFDGTDVGAALAFLSSTTCAVIGVDLLVLATRGLLAPPDEWAPGSGAHAMLEMCWPACAIIVLSRE
jgi:hypothetical protein